MQNMNKNNSKNTQSKQPSDVFQKLQEAKKRQEYILSMAKEGKSIHDINNSNKLSKNQEKLNKSTLRENNQLRYDASNFNVEKNKLKQSNNKKSITQKISNSNNVTSNIQEVNKVKTKRNQIIDFGEDYIEEDINDNINYNDANFQEQNYLYDTESISNFQNYIDMDRVVNTKYNQTKKKLFGRKINRYICRIAEDLKIRQIKLHQVTVALSMLTIVLIVISLTTSNIFAKEDKPEENRREVVEFEENENAIDLLEVLSDNISVTTRKDIIAEETEIEYSVEYKENDKLPKGEEHILEKGIKGKKETTYLRTYENEEMISEEVVGLLVLKTPKKEVVERGTSEYLAKHQVHIGERMILKEDHDLKAYKSYNSETITNILVYLDVILLDIEGSWCKVQFGGYQGYVNSEALVTETSMPGVSELSRKQRILSKVEYDMDLGKPSNMTREDFKKILTDAKDKNKIFENSSDCFYEMEQKYGINGVFVAAVGIHESGWGTSKIAQDKNNLFGYMAYDSDPYKYSANFETYQDGIETLTKMFCKYYLYPVGTPIYDGEVAKGTYYNDPTVYGVNVRYATDKEWCNKVYNIMEYLYTKLP